MRHVPGWAIGAAGVGVVAVAFVLGGRLAAADATPATLVPAEVAAGVQLECEPGQRAVLRQTSLACVSIATAPAGYVEPFRALPSPGYMQTVASRPTAAPRSTPVPRTSLARAPVTTTRSTKKSVAIIAGSAAAGAAVGGVAKGKKGAVIGGIAGGAAATIWDQVTRRRPNTRS